ncbi:Transcriptional regulatory protein LiaR [compost metagenome]
MLRRIAKNQSNQEIADGLYISVSTVKTHINNLFRKLDANDRADALRRAKDVGLPL